MNVRAKLLLSQSLNVVLILTVIGVAALGGYRFVNQLRRAELAYEQRQTMTMLAVQAFHYKTAIGDAVFGGRSKPGELELARRDVQATLGQLTLQTEQEAAFLSADARGPELEESELLGRLEASFAGIEPLVDQLRASMQAGSEDEAQRLHQLVAQRFEEGVAEMLAMAMADEQREVTETNAETVRMAGQLVAFLVVAGLCALIVSVATGRFLNRSISRPMRLLLGGVHALKAGDLRYRVDWKGSDEFAQLASQFNEMAANLEDRERRLLTAQSNLEQQVGQRTAELEAANRRLKYLDRQRLLFLADVSHELRTPVTVLRGEAEVTLRGQQKPPGEYCDALERIVQQAEQMGRLIDDLLFLTRTEADTISFDMQRVDLQRIVSEAVREGNVLGRGKGIAVVEKLPEQPIHANADPQRLRQAILIAIDNAIKHSDADSAIEVSLSERNGRAVIAVVDHGIGIPPEKLPYVFERFYSIGGSRDRRSTEGSGLGLPIAKWIAEKHEGTIALSSTPGQVTELVIELPKLDSSAP